jgi:hypothetical protein
MSSKRQTTMAKMKREQTVRERRVRKQEKKEERKRVAAEMKAAGITRTWDEVDTEAPLEGSTDTPAEAPEEAPVAATPIGA